MDDALLDRPVKGGGAYAGHFQRTFFGQELVLLHLLFDNGAELLVELFGGDAMEENGAGWGMVHGWDHWGLQFDGRGIGDDEFFLFSGNEFQGMVGIVEVFAPFLTASFQSRL